MTIRYGPVAVEWDGGATVRIEGRTGAVIYVDPARDVGGENGPPRDADLVLVTRAHRYDPAGIESVATEDALVIVHESIGGDESGRETTSPSSLPTQIERVGDDESFVLGPLDLWTTSAATRHDEPRIREEGTAAQPAAPGCGYGVTIDGITVFVPGDTDALPIHDSLDVDVFAPSIENQWTMNRHDAAELVDRMRPRLVVPIGYDATPDSRTDIEAFVVAVATGGVPVGLDD